jgi:hypothetical protein
MLPQIAAERLLESLNAPKGAISIWPWHEDDGRVTMVVVINSRYVMNESRVPKTFEGFDVRVERRDAPVIQRR